MPRPKKSEEQLAEMRERILDAAYEILKSKGPKGLTSRAIASRLGIAHMGLYTYFPNQAAILHALGQRELAKIQTQQQKIERRVASQDIVAIMRTALAFFPQFEKKNPQLYHLAWVIPQVGLENRAQTRARMQSNVQHLARLIDIGIKQGVFQKRDPQLAAAAVLGMMNIPLILFHSGRLPSAAMRDQLAGEMLEAAIRYLAKSEKRKGPGSRKTQRAVGTERASIP
jgi:AcrR family transcriptional regulator